MALAMSAMTEGRAVVAAVVSESIVSVRASNVNSSLSLVSFRRAGMSVSGLSAMQSSASIVGWKVVSPVRRLRVSAAEGSQTAESETVVAKPADKKASKPHNDEGKSTLDIVREVISEQLAVGIESLEPHTKFVDLGADSLDTVEIMMNLEERFDITIQEDGTESIATVKDAADLIDQVKSK
jgi:acyl carrier protein